MYITLNDLEEYHLYLHQNGLEKRREVEDRILQHLTQPENSDDDAWAHCFPALVLPVSV